MREEDKTKQELIEELSSLRRKVGDELYKASVESLLDGFAILSSVRNDNGKIIDFRYEYINEAGCRLNQRSREEHIGHTILELLPEHKRAGLIEEYAKVVETGMPLIKESYLYEDLYGEGKTIKRYFDFHAVKLGDGFTVTWRDVTERIRAEEDLRQSEERFRILADATFEAIAIHDKGLILEANKTFIKTFGYELEELIGKSVLDLAAPESRSTIMQNVMSGYEEPYEAVGLTKDGTRLLGEIHGKAIIYRGKPARIAAIRDITERKKTEKILSLQYKIVSLLAENRGLDETLKSTLKTVCEHVGWELADAWYVDRDADLLRLVEMWYADFLDGKEYEAFSRKTVFKRGEGVLGLVWQKGEPIWIEDLSAYSHLIRARIVAGMGFKSAFAFPIKVSSTVNGVMIFAGRTMRQPDMGLLNALFAVSSQIGNFIEKKRMEAEIEKMQRLESLGVLAGGIAHDFNNLLSGILGNISIAKMHLKPEDKAYKSLEEAEKASVRTKDLTGQLLTFAKGGEPVRKVTSVARLIKDSVSFALSGSRVKCEHSIPDGCWPVNVDEGQMHQVINNLLINADQAMPGGGTIEIRCKNTEINTGDALPLDNGSYVKVSIKDHGRGIPEPLLKRIFDPYFTTKEKGRGLGLATSYSILKRHNGLITVESQQDEGTTFHIYLPAMPSAAITKESSEEKIISGKGRILVMDDEEIVRQVAGEMLKALGYEVEFATDGHEAIKKYADSKESGNLFNMVIMDLTIPGGMGGKEAIERLRNIDPDVKAIVSSGYSNDPVMAEYKAYGFSSTITKPYSIEELSNAVHSALKVG